MRRDDESVFANSEAYKEEDVLRELYHRRGMTFDEIGEKFDVTGDAVRYWMDKYDIDHSRVSDERLLDDDWLYEKYWDEGKTQGEIGDVLGVCTKTVSNWIDKHDISVRDTGRRPAHYLTTENGYEYWIPTVLGEREQLSVHRMVAVAEWGFSAVAGSVVHHDNEVPWDNRVENLELWSKEGHISLHQNRRYEGEPWRDKQHLYISYIEEDNTIQGVADDLECSLKTAHKYLNKFDLVEMKHET